MLPRDGWHRSFHALSVSARPRSFATRGGMLKFFAPHLPCAVSTPQANIDGETNMKLRNAPKPLSDAILKDASGAVGSEEKAKHKPPVFLEREVCEAAVRAEMLVRRPRRGETSPNPPCRLLANRGKHLVSRCSRL